MNDVENKANKQEIKKTNTFWPITIAILISLGVFFGGMYISHCFATKNFIVGSNENAPALFGDSAGAVNALISAFAFAGVIVSMYLQRKDLELQRKSLDVQQEELKNNTEELKAQRKEFEAQNKTMKLQRFENTFFNMLSLQQEIVNNIEHSYIKEKELLSENILNSESITVSGRQVFEHLYEIDLKPTIKEYGLDAFNLINLNLFDHYFLYVYRIMKFVDETNLLDTKIERYSYISILRATLSRYELVYLFYNELNPIFSHFKELIEEYSLFNNINFASLIQSSDEALVDIKKHYKDSAYNPSIKGYNKLPTN